MIAFLPFNRASKMLMQFAGIMLVGLSAGYKVPLQSDHGMRQPNRIVGETFFLKDAVGLLELRQIAIVLFVKAVQPFMSIYNPPFRHDFRGRFAGCFNI